MKTLDKVIRANECCDHGEPDSRCEDCPYNGIGACCAERESDALHYLKVLQKMQKAQPVTKGEWDELYNPPLDWETLKQMEGKPVWVEYNLQIGDKEFRDKSKRWCIIGEFKPWKDTEITITENGFVLSKREQIKDWQAYRKERENETD